MLIVYLFSILKYCRDYFIPLFRWTPLITCSRHPQVTGQLPHYLGQNVGSGSPLPWELVHISLVAKQYFKIPSRGN